MTKNNNYKMAIGRTFALSLLFLLAVIGSKNVDATSSNHEASKNNKNVDEMECFADGSCVLKASSLNDDTPTSATSSKYKQDSEADNNQSDVYEYYGNQCGLYTAESAIPHSGLGMYTAKEIKDGSKIFDGDLVIQAEDPDVNGRLRKWYNKLSDDDVHPSSWLLDAYYWNPSNTLGEYDAIDVSSIIPGLGMLANSHTGLVNALLHHPKKHHTFHRYKDPSAGAVTNYHNLYYSAIGDIPAGSELYVEYGDSWFADRSQLGDIPLSNDFTKADEILQKFNDIEALQGNTELAAKVLDLVIETASLRPRFQSAFPRNVNDVQKAIDSGTAALSVPDQVRSIEWLEENGRCIDNIRPDVSTIPAAGMGAFATRQLQKDQIIAPMPLVQLALHQMEIYGADDIDDPESDIWFEGTQLLLNYVYGHPKTSLLFFPYAPVVNYINHNATLANVKLQWSTIPSNKIDWLEKTVAEIHDEDHAGLIMELVALRTIERGEEIFLDYGSTWEQAWIEHLTNWSPKDSDKEYVSASELNERNEKLLLRDEIENLGDDFVLYGPTEDKPVFTVCYVPDVKRRIKEVTTKRYKWYDEKDLFDAGNRFPCDMIERYYPDDRNDDTEIDIDAIDDDSDLLFTVVVRHKGKQMTVEDVPRHAIQYVDRPYKSDLSIRSAFRHEIHLPDHMVPTTWYDLE